MSPPPGCSVRAEVSSLHGTGRSVLSRCSDASVVASQGFLTVLSHATAAPLLRTELQNVLEVTQHPYLTLEIATRQNVTLSLFFSNSASLNSTLSTLSSALKQRTASSIPPSPSASPSPRRQTRMSISTKSRVLVPVEGEMRGFTNEVRAGEVGIWGEEVEGDMSHGLELLYAGSQHRVGFADSISAGSPGRNEIESLLTPTATTPMQATAPRTLNTHIGLSPPAKQSVFDIQQSNLAQRRRQSATHPGTPPTTPPSSSRLVAFKSVSTEGTLRDEGSSARSTASSVAPRQHPPPPPPPPPHPQPPFAATVPVLEMASSRKSTTSRSDASSQSAPRNSLGARRDSAVSSTASAALRTAPMTEGASAASQRPLHPPARRPAPLDVVRKVSGLSVVIDSPRSARSKGSGIEARMAKSRCRWCGLMASAVHEARKCAQRNVVCRHCRTTLVARDYDNHIRTCGNNRSGYSTPHTPRSLAE